MPTTDSIVSLIQAAQSAFVDDLASLVGLDCGTHNKPGVDRAGQWVAARGSEWGWEVERLPQHEVGDCWLARLRGLGSGRLMLIGHLDTVYPDGTAAARPMRFEDGKLVGPGVSDMKGGLLVGMYALRALQRAGFNDFEEITFFFSSDEEMGSPHSHALYAPLARERDAVFVLEAARANGDIVSARKGTGEFTLRVTGRAAHAGVEPEKGANAVLELAHQIIALHALNGLRPGVTVNPGVIGGGTRSNVVPDEAWVRVDVRATDPAGAETIARAVVDLGSRTTVPGTEARVEGRIEYPPMAKTPAIAFLAELAREAARGLGFEVNDTTTGGASDANAIAGLGVPVLDGLGPIGGLDHSPDEYIVADSIAPRTALLARLMQRALDRRERLAKLRG